MLLYWLAALSKSL